MSSSKTARPTDFYRGVPIDQVPHGAHVYIPRTFDDIGLILDRNGLKWLRKYLPKHSRRFLYIHHGIYHKELDVVIEFSKPREKPLAVKWKESVDVPDGRWTMAAAMYFIDLILCRAFHPEVTFSELPVFKNQFNKYYLYSYGDDQDHCHAFNSSVDRLVEGNGLAGETGDTAADVAKWFLHNPESFGEYKLMDLNCEHFAVFCQKVKRSDFQNAKEKFKRLPNCRDDARAFVKKLMKEQNVVSRQVSGFIGKYFTDHQPTLPKSLFCYLIAQAREENHEDMHDCFAEASSCQDIDDVTVQNNQDSE